MKSAPSEDRIDEGRQRFDARGYDEQQSGDAEKDGQRNEPPSIRVTTRETACELRDRPGRAAENDDATLNSAAPFQHSSASLRLSSGDPCLTTRV